jgi:hypothetical protein
LIGVPSVSENFLREDILLVEFYIVLFTEENPVLVKMSGRELAEIMIGPLCSEFLE